MPKKLREIPVIDLFAGPGGLGEGFSSLKRNKKPAFKIALSVEKDRHAHSTLRLRSFMRKLDLATSSHLKREFAQSKRKSADVNDLYASFPDLIEEVDEEVLADRNDAQRELGSRQFSNSDLDAIIRDRLAGAGVWALIGGPPCQAYSMVGRAKLKSLMGDSFEKDTRHFLYKQYLRIIGTHEPPIFVMENVKGMLSSTINGKRIVEQILEDLGRPHRSKDLSYRLYPFVQPTDKSKRGLFGDDCDATDYIVRAEDFGVPQKRHRVIILGIRSDIEVEPNQIKASEDRVTLRDILGDLPPLRSQITKIDGVEIDWVHGVKSINAMLNNQDVPAPVAREIREQLQHLNPDGEGYGSFKPYRRGKPTARVKSLYRQNDLGGVCNHEPRRHMLSDLHRYFYAACYGQVEDCTGAYASPKLKDFPRVLLPDHENVDHDSVATAHFADRFRVQLWDEPATTVTSHISKDGHYFIHPDPSQCRSLSVREAARIQTFPDDYIFLGTRTAQYHQVGNAVPPLLAKQLAEVVYGVLARS
ncbi:MAG: DNA cytosine methyltransferase [Planctomycetota bacterium]